LAGKIAYIYYRFDVSDEKFIGSVKDNGEYVKDRDGFIDIIKNMIKSDSLTTNVSILNEYKNLIKTNNTISNRNFINELTQAVCKKFSLPLELQYDTQNKQYEIHFYRNTPHSYGYYKNNQIHINENNLSNLKEVVKTIFHEVRHFYIDKYYKANDKGLKAYVYFSNKFYINYPIIFDSFYKICDNADEKNVGCLIGSQQDAYEIQPNERDPRYIETQIAIILP
ncbi:hypothetical protein CQA53_08605, partial [Helicobacter didelphidarum]